MNLRRVLTAVGAGVSTFLLVAVALTATLPFEFSAIVGLPVGLLAGVGVLALLLVTLEDLTEPVQRLITAYAVFGIAVVAALAARYANLGPSRDVLSTDAIAVGGVVLAVIAYAVLWWQDRTGRSRRAIPE